MWEGGGGRRRRFRRPWRGHLFRRKPNHHFQITWSGIQSIHFSDNRCVGKTTRGRSTERRSKGSPVSRVLFGDAATIIPLGRRLLNASSNLPGGMLSSRQSEISARRTRSPPVWSCSGWGLPSNRNHFRLWWALNPPFHPYHASLPKEQPFGGFFSVALSLVLRPVGVTDHPAHWSPDFPPASPFGEASDRPAIPSITDGIIGRLSPREVGGLPVGSWIAASIPAGGLVVSAPTAAAGLDPLASGCD